MRLKAALREIEAEIQQLEQARDALLSLSHNSHAPNRRHKLHWTQTPEGRKKMARIQRRWRKAR